MMKFPHIFLAALFVAQLVCPRPISAETVEAHKSSELDVVSIGAILDRNQQSVSNVKWFDANHLIGEFKTINSANAVSRLIGLNGELGAPLGKPKVTASHDGRTVFLQTEDGWELRDVKTNAAHKIQQPVNETGDFAPHYREPVWSSDSKYVAFIETYRPRSADYLAEPRDIAGVPVIELGDQGSSFARWASRINIVDRSNTAAVQRFVISESALDMAWDSNNTLFVTTANLFSGDPSTAIVRIRDGSKSLEEIYRSPGRFQSMTPALQPGGKLVALVLDVDNRVWDDFQSILLIDRETGEEVRRLTRDLPVLGGDYVWSNDGEGLYARVRHGGLDQVYAFPLYGKPKQLTHGLRRHFNIDLSADGKWISYQTKDGYGRNDIRILNIKSGEEFVVLVVDEPGNEFKLGKWSHVQWRSTDGVNPFGYVILPPDFDPTRQYPMVVDIHGGGPGSSLYLFGPLTAGTVYGPLEWHAWAALGYVVFVPDYRSTGDYGPKVITDIYNSGQVAAVKDIEDVISGTRYMVDQGFVDPSRIALFGHSAGGKRAYITLTIHSDLFAAGILNEAIAPDPVSSFIRLASGGYTGGYPAGIFRQYYGGTLAEVPERYKMNYMLDSYRNKTPTLIMVGNEKLGGVDHMPNEIMYSILKENGVPTRLLKFTEEGHNYSRVESAKFAFEEMRKWLETYMPAREH